MKNIFLFALCLVLNNSINAQDSSLGNWMIYIGNKQLNEDWNIHHEIQYRNYNAAGDLEQLLLRTGVGYNLTEGNNNILLGYGYINSKNYDVNKIFMDPDASKLTVKEHRVYLQFVTKQKLGPLSVQHRYRFEERFIEDDFKFRFRYFLGINLPLKKYFYLSAYNELFIHSKEAVFDRNRLYAGLGYKINKKMRLEFGYMNQFFENQGRDQINILCLYNF